MTARTHQSNTQSGTARTRSGSRSKARTVSSAGGSRQSSRGKRRKSEKSNKGARALLIMTVIGGVIGAVFVLAQRLQINTMHLKRAEEGLKSEIDTYTSQQRYLAFQKEKALSTQEAGKAADEFNLTQPGVGRAAARTEPETKTVVTTKAAAKPLATKADAKQQASAKQPGKVTKSSKVVTPVKTAKPIKQAQASTAKKDGKQVTKDLPNKNQTTKNQATKSLATKKEARR